MTVVRSFLYQVFFLSLTLVLGVVYLPLLLGSRRFMQRAASLWTGAALFLQRNVLGLEFECRGLDAVPSGPVLIAAKHQSAWDTLIFHHILSDPAYILKQELLSLPFIGWYLRKSGQVAIDRKAGIKALKFMVEAAKQAVAEGRQVIIFPEGHRQPPGQAGDYHSGVAMLRSGLGVPVIPVALNSGLFWGRNAFLRRSGMVVIEFLPPIPADVDRKQFMTVLEDRIETATRALEAEAIARDPKLDRLLRP